MIRAWISLHKIKIMYHIYPDKFKEVVINMVTDFEELVALCDEELRHREYRSDYYAVLVRQWDVVLCQEKVQLKNDLFSSFFATRFSTAIMFMN